MKKIILFFTAIYFLGTADLFGQVESKSVIITNNPKTVPDGKNG